MSIKNTHLTQRIILLA